LLGGSLMDKFGRKPALTFYFCGAAISSLLYGWVSSPAILFWLGPVSGFFTLGTYGPIAIYAAEIFPTSMRATGLGFSGGFGRVFSIATPTVIGFIALKFGIGAGFYLFFFIMVITTIVFLVFGPETKGRQLD
jgi:putative MFS transporter